jgi:hypothetical protein
MGRIRQAVLCSVAVLCLAAVVNGQVYKALTVTPDHTTGLVAPSSGRVSEDYQFWLVNSGQATEDVEVGFSDSSDGARGSVTPVHNPVGPGQTAVVTVTVEGTGGRFPYWVDFWARIVDGPGTGDTVRLTIDTVGSGVDPLPLSGSAAPGATVQRVAGDLVVSGAQPGAELRVFSACGRLVLRRMVPLGALVVPAGRGFAVVVLSGDGGTVSRALAGVR